MKTLQDLIDENPLVLFECTSDEGTFQFHYTVGTKAVMYDKSLHALDKAIWVLYEAPLDDQKKTHKIQIDSKTSLIIACGFIYDTYCFSLSDSAQNNWNRLQGRYADGKLAFPQHVTASINEDEVDYELTTATKLIAFMDVYDAAVEQAVNTGRALKLNIQAATTQEELDAVVDNRITQPYS